jgi:hypothetical protein
MGRAKQGTSAVARGVHHQVTECEGARSRRNGSQDPRVPITKTGRHLFARTGLNRRRCNGRALPQRGWPQPMRPSTDQSQPPEANSRKPARQMRQTSPTLQTTGCCEKHGQNGAAGPLSMTWQEKPHRPWPENDAPLRSGAVQAHLAGGLASSQGSDQS